MILKKFFLFSALLGFIIYGGYYLHKNTQKEIHESDNVFTSGVYRDFNLQLTAYLGNDLMQFPHAASALQLADNTFAKQAALFSKLLLVPPKDELEGQRDYHRQFIMGLRSLLEKKPEDTLADHEASAFIDQLNQWLLTSPELLSSMQRFLFAKMQKPSGKTTSEIIRNFHHNLRTSGFVNIYGDPSFEDSLLYGNLPSYLFTLNNSKKTKVLRLPTAVKDLSFFQSLSAKPEDSVQIEFAHQMQKLAENGENQLYVNLMRRKGTEGRKSIKLEKYEAKQPALILVTLDKDSPFYWQTGRFENSSGSESFKSLFLSELFNPKGNFYWTKKLDLKKWKERCSFILDKTHRTYFPNKSSLTFEERRDFIELTYLSLIYSLIEEFNPQFLNITCKQCMDRGPSLFTLLYINELLKEGKDPAMEQETILTMLFAPPLLIHNRPSHTSRIERLLSALEHLHSK